MNTFDFQTRMETEEFLATGKDPNTQPPAPVGTPSSRFGYDENLIELAREQIWYVVRNGSQIDVHARVYPKGEQPREATILSNIPVRAANLLVAEHNAYTTNQQRMVQLVDACIELQTRNEAQEQRIAELEAALRELFDLIDEGALVDLADEDATPIARKLRAVLNRKDGE